MIAAGYLIRLSPFTEAYLDLQGGSFDHADRLFWSVARAWKSASSYVRTVYFPSLTAFLTNIAAHYHTARIAATYES